MSAGCTWAENLGTFEKAREGSTVGSLAAAVGRGGWQLQRPDGASFVVLNSCGLPAAHLESATLTSVAVRADADATDRTTRCDEAPKARRGSR